MKRVLITGANRGIGLEFARQCLERGDHVFAGVRQPKFADTLRTLGKEAEGQLSLIALDVTDQGMIDVARDTIERAQGGLDLLINNAGINEESADAEDPRKHTRLGSLDTHLMLRMLLVNTVAPLMVAQEMLPLLKKGQSPKIASISTGLASIANAHGSYYSYATSKAGLNMAMRQLAADLRDDGIVSVLFNPGWVRTDMGGTSAPVDVTNSVKGMLQQLDNLELKDTGRFINWRDGRDLPW